MSSDPFGSPERPGRRQATPSGRPMFSDRSAAALHDDLAAAAAAKQPVAVASGAAEFRVRANVVVLGPQSRVAFEALTWVEANANPNVGTAAGRLVSNVVRRGRSSSLATAVSSVAAPATSLVTNLFNSVVKPVATKTISTALAAAGGTRHADPAVAGATATGAVAGGHATATPAAIAAVEAEDAEFAAAALRVATVPLGSLEHNRFVVAAATKERGSNADAYLSLLRTTGGGGGGSGPSSSSSVNHGVASGAAAGDSGEPVATVTLVQAPPLTVATQRAMAGNKASGGVHFPVCTRDPVQRYAVSVYGPGSAFVVAASLESLALQLRHEARRDASPAPSAGRLAQDAPGGGGSPPA